MQINNNNKFEFLIYYDKRKTELDGLKFT
jgi:hypothetical protein